jgi:hypothetical protein
VLPQTLHIDQVTISISHLQRHRTLPQFTLASCILTVSSHPPRYLLWLPNEPATIRSNDEPRGQMARKTLQQNESEALDNRQEQFSSIPGPKCCHKHFEGCVSYPQTSKSLEDSHAQALSTVSADTQYTKGYPSNNPFTSGNVASRVPSSGMSNRWPMHSPEAAAFSPAYCCMTPCSCLTCSMYSCNSSPLLSSQLQPSDAFEGCLHVRSTVSKWNIVAARTGEV